MEYSECRPRAAVLWPAGGALKSDKLDRFEIRADRVK